MTIQLSSLHTQYGRQGPPTHWINAIIQMQDGDMHRWMRGRPALGNVNTADAFTRALLDFLPRADRIRLLQQSLIEEMESNTTP